MSSQISDECVGEEREIEVEVDRARTRRGCFWKRWTETRKYREVSLRFERAKGFIARPRIRFGVWAGELSTSELVACELPEAGRTSSRGGLHASYILLQPFFFLHHVSTAPPLGLDRFFEFLSFTSSSAPLFEAMLWLHDYILLLVSSFIRSTSQLCE